EAEADCVRASGGGENVVDVRATDERRSDLPLALWRHENHARPGHRELYVARGDFGFRFNREAEHASARARKFLRESPAVLVVSVYDGDARRLAEAAVEEAALRVEVSLHRAVVVEVIAREVREGRDLVTERVAAPKV